MKLHMNDFDYDLPDERIARHPLDERDQSQLLVVDTSTAKIQHRTFREVPEWIPTGSVVLMNASRVITARLPCKKATGGAAEVLLLSPLAPSSDPTLTLAAQGPTRWHALIGGKRIQAGDWLEALPHACIQVLKRTGAEAEIELIPQERNTPSGEVIEKLGTLPLPPYLKRESTEEDCVRYQTVYADRPGSVAAPTAGLHFTPELLAELQNRGARLAQVHLHVGAGTFKPVEVEDARDHAMHAERIEVAVEVIETLAECAAARERGAEARVIAVGTTSLRTLESLAVSAQRLSRGGLAVEGGWVARQWEGREGTTLSDSQLFRGLAEHLKKEGLPSLTGLTSLMIAPDLARFHADRLITNFHQPRSTLLLLVSAFAGDAPDSPRPLWKQAYQEALLQNYRFLSYGDSSLWVRS